MPIRGILLPFIADPYLIIAIQLFDGFSAAPFGVLFPLIAADVTRETVHYTTSLGLVGLAIGGGATLSTTVAGFVADHLGVRTAFLSLAAVGLCATALVWTLMPETSGENQTEGSGTNGRNLRPTVDPMGSIRMILSTRVAAEG